MRKVSVMLVSFLVFASLLVAPAFADIPSFTPPPDKGVFGPDGMCIWLVILAVSVLVILSALIIRSIRKRRNGK